MVDERTGETPGAIWDKLGSMAAAPASRQEAQDLFERQLESTYQHAVLMRAVAENVGDVAAAARAELQKLAAAGYDDAGSPMGALGRRLDLTSAQKEFLWSVVACSFDARVMPHVEAIGGAHARRGLSLSVYALLAGLGKHSLIELAHWLAAGNPLVATGLLVATEQASPTARPYIAFPYNEFLQIITTLQHERSGEKRPTETAARDPEKAFKLPPALRHMSQSEVEIYQHIAGTYLTVLKMNENWRIRLQGVESRFAALMKKLEGLGQSDDTVGQRF